MSAPAALHAALLRAAALDGALLRVARTAGHSPRAERAAVRLTRCGEHGAIWLATGLAAARLDGRGRAQWHRATAAVAGSYLLNTAIKLALRRRRPDLAGLPALINTPTSLSFPSAHATTSFLGARAFGRLGMPRAPLYALAGSLALSRVYLGVHYPSDVLAGAALGTALARLAR